MIIQNTASLLPGPGSLRVNAGGLQGVNAAPAGGLGVAEQPGGLVPAAGGGGVSVTVGIVEPGALGAKGPLGAAAGPESSSDAPATSADSIAPWLTILGLVLVGYGLHQRAWVPAGVGLASLSRGGRAGFDGLRSWVLT